MSIKKSINIGAWRHPQPHKWFELVNPTRGYYSRLTLEELEWLREEPTPNFRDYGENYGHNYNEAFDWKWLWEKEIENRIKGITNYIPYERL